MASRNIFLPKESNRRIPNGTYGGVRGMNNLYSIAFPTPAGRLFGFAAERNYKTHRREAAIPSPLNPLSPESEKRTQSGLFLPVV